MNELSRLTNGVAFGLEKRIIKPPVSQKKADLRKVLKDLAHSDFPSMQADVETFYKKLKNNTDLKLKKCSKNMKDWYTKSFVYPEPPKEVTPTVKKKKKPICQPFKFILSGVRWFEIHHSLQTLKWPQSKNRRMQWSAFPLRFAKIIVWKTDKRCT